MVVAYNPLVDVHNYSINTTTREVFLHSYIGDIEEEAGVDYRMSVLLQKNLRLLDSQSNKSIVIHMNTIGGNWSDGIAIYDAIMCCRSHITILAYAFASSMSSIILQAADSRVLMPNTGIMVHFGTSGLSELDSIATYESVPYDKKFVTEKMLDIYAEKCSAGRFFADKSFSVLQTKRYIKSQLIKRRDWYMSAADGVKYGFADGILHETGFEASNILFYK